MNTQIITVVEYEAILKDGHQIVFLDGELDETKAEFVRTFGDKGFVYPLNEETHAKYMAVYTKHLMSKSFLNASLRSCVNPEALTKQHLVDDALIQRLLSACIERGVDDPATLTFIENKLPKGKMIKGISFVALTTAALVYYNSRPAVR